MKLFVAALLSLLPVSAFAGEVCENYAKYFAIRDYKSQVVGVQGSDGMMYESELVSITPTADGEEYLYTVQISENNEDGEYWTWEYEVLLSKAANSAKCKLEKMKSEIWD